MRSRYYLPSGITALMLTLILGALYCYPSAAPTELTDGIWTGSVGDRQFVVEFTGTHFSIHALMHTMLDGRRVTENFANAVYFNPPSIEIQINGDLTYRGQVDLEGGLIAGEISGLVGDQGKLDLRRVAPRAVAGFLARPQADSLVSSYSWSRPADTDDGWQTASPEEVGLNREDLERTVTAIIDGEVGLIHSLLIVRHGKLVLEEYFHGYDRADLNDIGTCTIGISSLLTGIALDRGEIEGLAIPIPDFFPTLGQQAAAGWERISLEHLLTMTSVSVTESGFSVKEFAVDDDFFSEVLSTTPHPQPGTEWLYTDRHANLIAGILQNATGLRADRFADAHLFEPLGIERYEWKPELEERHPRMHNGLMLRPRDLAKIGEMVLRGGIWNGRRIVSADYISAATSPQSRSPGPDPEDYGYLWWVVRLPESGGGGPVFMVWGLGTQFLYVAPTLDSVFVLTGGNRLEKSFLAPQALADRLLAAYEPR